MTELARCVAAVVVSFAHPEAVARRLPALTALVGTVVVVDNAAVASPDLHQAAVAAGAEFIHGQNRGGLAGAYNQALAALAHRPDGPRHVIWLDDDSDLDGLAAFLADPDVEALLNEPLTAAVAPAYRDAATGLRGHYIDLGRWRVRHLGREFTDVRPVAFLINSMSLWRLDALARIGPFDEQLAIDHVDTDACLRARQRGLKLYVHGRHGFLHRIGQRRAYRLFGRTLQAGGHPAPRRFLIARNTCLLIRRWAIDEPAFGMLCAARIAYEAVGILLAEDDVGAKMGALLRGAMKGLFEPLQPRKRPA